MCLMTYSLDFPVLQHFTYKCRLLITFANSLDADKARHIVGPDPDPNCFQNIAKINFENFDF